MSKKNQQAVKAVDEVVEAEAVDEVVEVEAVEELTGIVKVLLNLRAEPSLTGKVILILNPKEILNVLSLEEEWAHVVTSSGKVGYVRSEFITVA